MEGLDLSFTGDDNSTVTKSTITTAVSMAAAPRARPKWTSSESSYANKHVKKMSPPVPPRAAPPSTNNSSRSSNGRGPQWNKGFVSEEEKKRRGLRERQAAFAKQLKEQNRKKMEHQRKMREQRILEHQRQQEQEQGSVRSAPVTRQQHDLPLPPQYANSSDDALLKTMKQGGKAAFQTGLTMDEEVRRARQAMDVAEPSILHPHHHIIAELEAQLGETGLPPGGKEDCPGHP